MPEVISLFRLGSVFCELLAPGFEIALIQGLTNFLHEIQVVVQIVNRVQSGAGESH